MADELETSYADLVAEVILLLNYLLDESNIDLAQLKHKQNELQYVLGQANTAALQERATAPQERVNQIDAHLRSLTRQANQAFARIDLITQQTAVNTGARPKRPESLDIPNPMRPPQPQRQSITPPIPSQQPSPKQLTPPRLHSPMQPPLAQPTQVQANTGGEAAAVGGEQPIIEGTVLSAILNQIKTEFTRILQDQQGPGPSNKTNDVAGEDSDLSDYENSLVGDTHDDDAYVPSPDETVKDEPVKDVPAKKDSKKSNKVNFKAEPCPLQPLKPLMQLKFDRVTLGNFDGDHTNWIPFRDEFIEYVHENENLTAVMKFHQLRTHLEGIALEAISGFSMCATDYEAAWNLLLERYNNNHMIVMEYIRKFFELPILTGTPSSNAYLRIINRTNQLIRVMPTFGYQVSSWDPILIYNITIRLDAYALRKWTDQIKKRQKIALSELLEFLEVQSTERVVARAEPHKPIGRSSNQNANRRKNNQARVMVATEQQPSQTNCTQCKKSKHPMFMCFEFKKLSVKNRYDTIKAANLCIQCLTKHDGQPCKFKACAHCQGKHNNLLCYQKEKDRKKSKINALAAQKKEQSAPSTSS